MVNRILDKGKKFLTNPQETVLSAATVIMIMIVGSRVLGLVRQRVLAHLFTPSELSLFFAAFRLPDLVFEVLVFGTFSSAFIPVFSRALDKGDKHAWDVAAIVVNLGLIIFLVLSVILGLAAEKFYSLLAPGFSQEDQIRISGLARVLFLAQGFFVVSYVLTGVLESLRRFLIPALAPLFYNLGIILGTLLFSSRFNLMAPALGVGLGAFSHFLVQLPLSLKLGFRFKAKVKINDDVKKIGKLALPRLIETAFLQIARSAELFFASLVSIPAYTYFTFANTLQLLPVGLFGTSIAKAALPTLSRQVDSKLMFKKTLLEALYQMVFLILPVATALLVLRIPIVRLVYGTDIFGWEATVQTGLVLSAFAVGIVFQSSNALLSRAFYALHDTKLPVAVSITSIFITLILDYLMIGVLKFDIWGLALSFSFASGVQSLILFYLINKRIDNFSPKLFIPFVRTFLASSISGGVMYFILKFFDRSVWVKKISFLGKLEVIQNLPFEKFVLDTRYTINLLILTVIVLLFGGLTYLVCSLILGSEELFLFLGILKRLVRKHKVAPIPKKETETVAPTPTDSAS